MAYVPQDLLLRDWRGPQTKRLGTILISTEYPAQLICHGPLKILVPAEKSLRIQSLVTGAVANFYSAGL